MDGERVGIIRRNVQIHLSRKLYLFIYPKHSIQCHISKTILEDEEEAGKRENG